MLNIASPEFCGLLAQTARDAICSYTQMSGMGRWYTPESWIQRTVVERFAAPDHASLDRHCAILVAEIEPDEAEREKLRLLRAAVQVGLASGVAKDFSFESLNGMLDEEWARKQARESAH